MKSQNNAAVVDEARLFCEAVALALSGHGSLTGQSILIGWIDGTNKQYRALAANIASKLGRIAEAQEKGETMTQ